MVDKLGRLDKEVGCSLHRSTVILRECPKLEVRWVLLVLKRRKGQEGMAEINILLLLSS